MIKKAETDPFYPTIILAMVLSAVMSLIVYNCGSVVVDPVEPEPLPDPYACDSACTTMGFLGCDGWRGSPGKDEVFGTSDDVSCSEVCTELSQPGSIINLCPKCVSTASSCEEVDNCRGDCE